MSARRLVWAYFGALIVAQIVFFALRPSNDQAIFAGVTTALLAVSAAMVSRRVPDVSASLWAMSFLAVNLLFIVAALATMGSFIPMEWGQDLAFGAAIPMVILGWFLHRRGDRWAAAEQAKAAPVEQTSTHACH